MAKLPSLTAMIVAFARGAGSRAPDPAAAQLVPRGASDLLRATHWAAAASAPVDRALRLASFGLVDHITLRTLAIDDVVRDAVHKHAIQQVVVLGAGLDARAHRMQELEGAIVFEVDHPATQGYKRKKADAMSDGARVVYVGVDFERDDLDVKLTDAGHEPRDKTLWIWEGVTPYLTHDAIGVTLDIVAGRSAKGSILAMTYVTPELISGVPVPRAAIAPMFRLIGEPLTGVLTSEGAARLARGRGFEPDDDSGPREWAARAEMRRPTRIVGERLLVARRV